MAVPILPNPSNFLGVALVINRSRDGPRFVFHYPPKIPPISKHIPNKGTPDKLDDDDVLLDCIPEPNRGITTGPKGVDLTQWDHDEHLETDSGSQVVPWEHVGGFPTKDLESLLTPARAFHKKLFQISLDQLYAVSYPIYAPESGLWKKKKKQAKSRPSNSKFGGEDGDASIKPDESVTLAEDVPPIEIKDMATETEGADEAVTEGKKSGMTMFNLVFILNPKKHEAKQLVDTLYFHIIRKINKAYKYSQQRSDFVWKESKRILLLKDKGREDKTRMTALWREILETSSLASSMQDIYEAVSQNKIAALQLGTAEGTLTHSVQIPVPFYLPDLPSDNEISAASAGSKGLWITTANSFADADALDDPSFLDRNFALLLLNDEKKIIAELQADPDETTNAMVEFVRLSKPTMSFHQIGHAGILSPAQVRKYAQHFIFWRRAIAVPPLHARDVYIISPNSSTDSLPTASQAWAKAFPLAPPLPNFLADLSNAPRPYKWFSPSKAHRPTYLQMLAWLMRGGWVTQLCTFAYVVVWPEIQYEVEYQLEADELRRSSSASDDGASAADDTAHEVESREASPGSTIFSDQRTSSSPEAIQRTANEQVAEKARLDRLADRASRLQAEKAAQHARKQVPINTDHPSINTAAHLAKLEPYIIVDAKKATGKDSLYLSAIGRRFRDPKVRASWPVFWKYFNGRSALERIALQEDSMKRKEAWGLLTGMSEFLLTVRHW
ncbi:nitrogen permease regulator of amino acid transport activity 3-domain-containing protein [Pseudomassariella vexata]|uniref:Nitrogen permease regulator 3 n=1 Tax=Pseudomassariella vexata TaxID=1141098 RepID=A0A1Y2E4I9_9PEZI|nr:nitrogen permease regulator of amino acid transport activity 3-domain-containing protein [Pseudomassariella vexata]ORY66483.1 nitrogen permease regulator of amino acid transport activity 3-domain-containing protein [Pseudomassariella vexata]